ncbi:uncharacterized protein LOC117892963 [Drosophila subobscura]|uniref:uncharacterized protein LOC117892963 n=1 Tax=Drosophila subobscura TaxID=7241 RepID=UPI00155A8EF9|nr:uncharacterized protein LOC117892963 [Drosophila subobscura]
MDPPQKSDYSAEYFEKALVKAHQSPNLRVESFHIEVLSQNGENFCSVIYRVVVGFRKTADATLKTGRYIIKDLLPVVAELGTNEKTMFEELLPEMDDILGRAPPSLGEHKLSADCLLADATNGKEVYVLEDLGALGYASMDRFRGLGLEDAQICLRKMAQFHAASMVLCQQQPELVAKLSPSHYADGVSDPFAQVIVVGGTEYAAEVFAQELPQIAKKMKAQIPEEYSKRIRAVVDPKNSAFNVIVHGDLWVNNMMLDRSNGNAILVDFQNCFLGSPAIDVQFFFYTSLQLEVLLHQQDALLQHYYHSLTETLKLCGYTGSVPTFEQLMAEMQRCLYYGYYAVACELPICCASPEASSDFNLHTFGNKQALEEKRRQLFASERVRQTIKAALLTFEQQGILETP